MIRIIAICLCLYAASIWWRTGDNSATQSQSACAAGYTATFGKNWAGLSQSEKISVALAAALECE